MGDTSNDIWMFKIGLKSMHTYIFTKHGIMRFRMICNDEEVLIWQKHELHIRLVAQFLN